MLDILHTLFNVQRVFAILKTHLVNEVNAWGLHLEID